MNTSDVNGKAGKGNFPVEHGAGTDMVGGSQGGLHDHDHDHEPHETE